MAEPGQLLSKIDNLSKIYHQAKCRMSETNEPTRALNMYDPKKAEEWIKAIKESDYQRQHPLRNNFNEDEGSRRQSTRDSREKGFQM